MSLGTRRTSDDLEIRDALRASWIRSADAGLLETERFESSLVSQSDVIDAQRASCKLLKYAEASLQNSYEQVAGTRSIVLLTDANGVILASRGDDEFLSGELGRFFLPGQCWAERIAGTNAIGTCLVARAPIVVNMDDHYRTQFRSLAGTAAPVFDHLGGISGVLAVYTISAITQLHTLAFMRTVAVLIENRMVARDMVNEIIVHFHPVAEYIDTIKQGIIALRRDGTLLGTNSAAREILGLNRSVAHALRFADLFASEVPWERFVEKARTMCGGQFVIKLRDGHQLTLVVNIGATCQGDSSVNGAVAPQSGEMQRLVSGNAQVLLNALDLGDPLMHRAIHKASMILGSDIPLLIEGESGVGKEVFTVAFHNSGPRRSGPFVAVNCAAIPEGLIESELFGYEEGAFTGAKKKGHLGRIQQADGGTLFLDEIGDMPLALQGRLLRVLQERQVTPLGSTRSVTVDVSIVCATHRTLLTEVAEGRFREDLYYRLNGLRVRLPSLRQRTDIDRVIDLLIETEAVGRRIHVAPDVRRALRTHPWPGNIRQLHMVLRTALAILRSGDQLTLEHFPDEFTEADVSDESTHHEDQSTDLERIQLAAIRRAIDTAGGNLSQAARTLGISRKTLYRKLEKTFPK